MGHPSQRRPSRRGRSRRIRCVPHDGSESQVPAEPIPPQDRRHHPWQRTVEARKEAASGNRRRGQRCDSWQFCRGGYPHRLGETTQPLGSRARGRPIHHRRVVDHVPDTTRRSAGELGNGDDIVNLGVECADNCELATLVDPAVFQRLPLPYAAGWLAGQAFVKYRRAGGTKSSPLPDFYNGAHAVAEGLALPTRDGSRYRTYSPVSRSSPLKRRAPVGGSKRRAECWGP
jgi:hypothetical protein